VVRADALAGRPQERLTAAVERIRPNSWRYATLTVLLAVFGIEFYRAATQSFTIDEARVYLDFIRPDPPVVLREYDAAHHVLHTYLTLLVSRFLGGSELVLRLPTVFACAAFLAFVYRLNTRLFSRGVLTFAATLVLALNPLILDHFSIARGYGLALALFAWALYATISFFESGNHKRLSAAGMLTGLSVAANLTFLFPACALVLCTAVLYAALRRPRLALVNEYLGPAVVVCAVLVVLPLRFAKASNFYFGSAVLYESLRDLTEDVFARGSWRGRTLDLGYAMVLAAVSVALVALIRALRRRSPGDLPVLIVCGTCLLGIALLIAAHSTAKVLYPFGRTGLWVVFLVELSGVVASSTLAHRRSIAVGFAVLSALVTFVRVPQIDPRYVQEWRPQARVREMMQIVRARQLGDDRPFRVSGDPNFAWGANYYRVRFRMSNMEPAQPAEPKPGANYYLFEKSNSHYVRELNLRVIYEDGLCACVLAIP
jgi:uncharacterized membrane protein